METGHVLLTVLHHFHFLIGPVPLDDTAESIAHEKGNGWLSSSDGGKVDEWFCI